MQTYVYVLQIFPVTGFRHSFYPGTLWSVYAPLPLKHLHMLSCQSKHHRFSSSSPWTPLCSCSSQLPQLPHLASVSRPSRKTTLPVCWPVQLGTPKLGVIAPGPAEAHALLCWHHRLTSPCDLWSDSMSWRCTWAPSSRSRESCKRRLTVQQDRHGIAGHTDGPAAC